ncbi:MAG: baseplate J/gp47 family protein [Pseudomonadota bacterium]
MATDEFIRLVRDGQSRRERFPEQLDPVFAKIDDHSLEDLWAYAQNYASKLRFFDVESESNGADWAPFFDIPPEEVVADIDKRDDHPPHLALYIAFLQLLRHAQNGLNRITARHLDFYYGKVLRMVKRQASPDHLHLLFELKKNSPDTLLKTGDRLSAGKDRSGKELLYTLKNDVSVYHARVASLRALFYDDVNDALYASPVANSADGKGEALDQIEPIWPPFGDTQCPRAEIGFAIASPALLLAEGSREIVVRLKLSDAEMLQGKDSFGVGLFKISLTGPKGWHPAQTLSLQESERNPLEFQLQIVLPPDAPATANYSQAIHGDAFDTSLPIMKIILNPDLLPGRYRAFRNIRLISIDLHVAAKGMKNLSLSNDAGALNPTKPFLPFGPVPEAGSRFTVGCAELDGKNVTSSSLNITWRVATKNLQEQYVGYDEIVTSQRTGRYLVRESNSPIVTGNAYFKAILSSPGGRVNVQLFAENAQDQRHLSPPPFYTACCADRPRSHFALILGQSFLHEYYRRSYPVQLARIFKGEVGVSLLQEPYTPLIDLLTLDYCAEDTAVDFFHLTAFGQVRQTPGTTLLPLFPDEGELYIGVEGLKPLQRLSLLVRVAEGSGDPDQESQKIVWSVLSDNLWWTFGEAEVTDGTNGFLKTGIISFAIPEIKTENNTIFDKDMIWLKAAVACHTEAVCRLINVQANAGVAEFVDQSNDPSHLAQPLPAQSVTRFVGGAGTIKTVRQPDGSIDGKAEEDESAFRLRVSERLRHKNRAVALWDFERLVLANFPSIYRVKCLNHTALQPALSFNAPGNVTLVVIPDAHNKNAVNPLQPKVDLNTLDEIASYLKRLTGPHVKVHVMNPRYETVRFMFGVRFIGGSDYALSWRQLQNDLKGFLCPWALSETDMRFEGRLDGATAIALIENLPYVDRINDFRMFQDGALGNPVGSQIDNKSVFTAITNRKAGRTSRVKKEFFYRVSVAKASTPLSVLVSAREHNITGI